MTSGEIVSKKPGRSPGSIGFSKKKQLSTDAKIIRILLKEQPLTGKEICEKEKINPQTFSRHIKFLLETNLIKSLDNKYALWNFDPIETQIESAFSILFQKCMFVSSDLIACEVGKPWSEIESLTLKIAKKLGSKITKENYKYKFYRPGSFKT